MTTLNEQQISHLRSILNEREKALRIDIRREVNGQDNFAQLASDVPDDGDASFADLSIDLGNAAISRDLQELRAIEKARRRMAENTYGECVECETEIPYERLEVQPTAERCSICQNVYEKTHMSGVGRASM